MNSGLIWALKRRLGSCELNAVSDVIGWTYDSLRAVLCSTIGRRDCKWFGMLGCQLGARSGGGL